MAAEGELLTVAEAARVLRVSTVTMRRWLKQGRLPAYQIGPRAVRIRRQDLDMIVTPAREVAPPTRGVESAPIQTAIRPLTKEEKRRGLEALEESRALIAETRARRGGKPLAESWPMIREAREERSKQQL